MPVRLGSAELTLIEQLHQAGAAPEAEVLATVGLPTRKVEAYHYTDLKQLWRDVPALAGTEAAGGPTLSIPDALVLSIVNGRVGAHTTPPRGVHVSTAKGAAISGSDDILVRLNRALSQDCLRLHIDQQVDTVVHIDRRIEGSAAHSASAAGIFVGDGARVTIVETFGTSAAAHVGNHSTFLSLGRGAEVTHITVDLSHGEARTFSSTEYTLGENANLRTLVVQAGSALSRSLIHTAMAGEGANAHLTGLNLVSEGQHHDITLQVNHKVPRTGCKPLYKQIARGRSKAVFQGRLVVDRGAQKTDAKMSMQGLMLSDEAEILSKPELEIYADDVVCGHGSTCGRLDENALFYLMSRGVPKTEAETMLVRAFLAELIDPIEPEPVRDVLTAVIEGWLGR